MNLSFRPANAPPEEKPIQIVLASQSTGRKSLLEKFGIPFRTIVSNVDEDTISDKDPFKTIKKRADAKADEIVKNQRLYGLPPEGKILIIAADSMAVLGTKTFGKSVDKDHAKETLRSIMGKAHVFATAMKTVYLVDGKEKKVWSSLTKTRVTLKKLNNPELDSYVGRYDISRFAAAYSINETPWDLVTKIDGSYTNVVGLPFEELLPILRKLEIIA